MTTRTKKRGLHPSFPKELKNRLNALEKRPDIKRVIMGPTESARHRYSPGHLRYAMDIPGGIKARGYTGGGVIEIYIYCADREAIRKELDG
ncbi:hypothetical protein HY256_04400 [Candidatus Sumerlaeota bacterium]|nr:hypothetical protein [Candidatus Sumerlaeota bacterium]